MISLPSDVLQREIDGNLEGSYRSELLKLYSGEDSRLSIHFEALGPKYRLHKPGGMMTEFSHRSLPIIGRWLVTSGHLNQVAKSAKIELGQVVTNNMEEILLSLRDYERTEILEQGA